MEADKTPFAVIKTGGKQYIVRAGQKLRIEKLDAKEGASVSFPEVLLTTDERGNITIGTPTVTGAKVDAKILRQARDRKVIVFKYRPKARSRKKAGHRQHFTEIEITKIPA